MVAIKINGQEAEINAGGVPRITDLIELIKASIDPAHIITAIRIDGHDLSDQDWQSSVSQYTTSVLEIETGTPEAFVADRILHAAEVVRACYIQFRDARKRFQEGNMLEGNKFLAQAVNTIRSFFEWYGTISELYSDQQKRDLDINQRVLELSEVCQRICQQQLYQSWWALGETIAKDLEPKLDELEDFFRRYSARQQ